MDFIRPDGTLRFYDYLIESDPPRKEIVLPEGADALVDRPIEPAVKELDALAAKLALHFPRDKLRKRASDELYMFYCGLFIRFFHSVLVDADRTDAAAFGAGTTPHLPKLEADWSELIALLELEIAGFQADTPINAARAAISSACKRGAENDMGIFRLSVPTGAGKTLASLRFALYHARKHGLSRVIYVLPFTTILTQNVAVIRDLFKKRFGMDIVLEHHSNVLREETQDGEPLPGTENWDKQIILTTTVQFMDAFYGHGASKSRRMHNLANACVIFDEVQSIPLHCLALFNGAITFLTRYMHTTALLCTATQPVLDQVPCEKYRLAIPEGADLFPGTRSLDCFDRVDVIDKTKSPLSTEQQADLLMQQMESSRNCMIVVNAKYEARRLASELKTRCNAVGIALFHLSTNMCSAHREAYIERIRAALKGSQRCILVSTSLVEAGVDISFECVIRHVAGLDSVVQAAGRCNRNGELAALGRKGRLILIRSTMGIPEPLKYVRYGAECLLRILGEASDPNQLFLPEIINKYFALYYGHDDREQRSREMRGIVRMQRDNKSSPEYLLTDLLSINTKEAYNASARLPFMQALESANSLFHVIDQDTIGVIVPYEEGTGIIEALRKPVKGEALTRLLRKAQRYTINVFANQRSALLKDHVIELIHPEYGLYALDSRYYDRENLGFVRVGQAMEDLIP